MSLLQNDATHALTSCHCRFHISVSTSLFQCDFDVYFFYRDFNFDGYLDLQPTRTQWFFCGRATRFSGNRLVLISDKSSIPNVMCHAQVWTPFPHVEWMCMFGLGEYLRMAFDPSSSIFIRSSNDGRVYYINFVLQGPGK